MNPDEIKNQFGFLSPPEYAKKVFESRGLKPEYFGVDSIDAVKYAAAVLFTVVDNIVVPPGNTEAGRLVSLAKTDLESCVMWAVKAISRQ